MTKVSGSAYTSTMTRAVREFFRLQAAIAHSTPVSEAFMNQEFTTSDLKGLLHASRSSSARLLYFAHRDHHSFSSTMQLTLKG